MLDGSDPSIDSGSNGSFLSRPEECRDGTVSYAMSLTNADSREDDLDTRDDYAGESTPLLRHINHPHHHGLCYKTAKKRPTKLSEATILNTRGAAVHPGSEFVIKAQKA